MKSRGATLLELMVAMSIAASIFFILGAIFLAQSRYFAVENAIAETQYNAFQVIDTFGLYASSAQQVISGMTINGTAYTTGVSTVILMLPSVDTSGNVITSTYDYVAFGLDPDDPSLFIYDIDASANSARLNGTFRKAALVDKLIFRYNTVSPSAATAIDVYVRTVEEARGQILRTPLGKIYYLGSS